jgi:hypothetical protein
VRGFVASVAFVAIAVGDARNFDGTLPQYYLALNIGSRSDKYSPPIRLVLPTGGFSFSR